MATITFGTSGVPSAKTVNFDALFSTSLANYKKTLEDNISTSTPFFKKIKSSGAWESYDGGTHIEIPLMYELGTADTYGGYDVLDTTPMDGITKAIYEWSRCSIPITISGDESTDNYGAGKLIDLMSSKMQQAELGLTDFFNKQLLQGNGINAGSTLTAYVSPTNGSLGLNPIGDLIQVTPSGAANVGNIAQDSNVWWRNQTEDMSGVTTTTGLLQATSTLLNNCGKGAGGKPDMVICDQTTWELLIMAIYHRTRHDPSEVADFPFDNFKFRNVMFVWDEHISDPVNDVTNTDTAGVMYALNTKYFSVKYHPQRNLVHRKFQEPWNQDAKVSHILWKGQVCLSNRRKHGVGHTIPRTLTIS